MNKIKRTNLEFAAGQYLPEKYGNCRFLHGHNYKASIVVTTEKVVDFKLLKEVFKELDHVTMSPEKHLCFWTKVQDIRNEFAKKHNQPDLPVFKMAYLPVDELTVEEIGKYIRKRIESIPGVQRAEVELFETDNCSAIIDEEVSR